MPPRSVAVALALMLVPATTQAQAPASPYVDPARGVFSFAGVLAQVLPSVVQIAIVGDDAKPARAGRAAAEDRGQNLASGSGVIVDATKGFVLTNDHVVARDSRYPPGPFKVRVLLRDGREYSAAIVGEDALTDIAVLRIPADHLNAITIADSDAVQVGDVVLAVGYPLGLDQSVTFGVVSGLRRHLDDQRLENFIQTDAAINHGNSGGPLVDSRGRLVGINTAIANPYGQGNIGLNFAVPTRIAMSVTAQLERYGTVHRGRAGIVAADLTPPLAKALGVSIDHGALIREVDPEEPAARAGLRVGDIVISAGEIQVSTTNDLRTVMGLAEIGDAIPLHFYRDGREREITVTITAAPTAIATARTTLPAVRSAGDEVSLFGATFRATGPAHLLRDHVAGVTVTAVSAKSAAAAQGLKPGDVIDRVNNRPIRDLATFKAAIAAATEAVALRVVRGGATRIAVFARTGSG